MMAFVGMEWIIVIVAIILFLFGAKKIPELARGLGKATGEFNRGKYLVQKEMRFDGLLSQTEPAPEPTVVDEAPKSVESRSPITQAAENLGIPTEGRSEQELKAMIKERVTGEPN
jgi:sec-independent protein translocase protein TatA